MNSAPQRLDPFQKKNWEKKSNIASKMPEQSNKQQCHKFLLKEWGCFGTKQNMEVDQQFHCKLTSMSSLTLHKIIEVIYPFVAQHEIWNPREIWNLILRSIHYY